MSATLDRHCLDLGAVLAEVARHPAATRLSRLLARAGCRFHDAEGRLVAGPAARLTALGGLPFAALAAHGIAPEAAAALTRGSMGMLGAMSYLSVPGGRPEGAYDTVVGGHGHGSVAHGASVSVLVAGISTACANEFNCQRDLVHLARITEARTAVQSAPPVVVPHPSLIPVFAQHLKASDRMRRGAEHEIDGIAGRDALEAMNLLFPAAKATALVITGSLRNLQKLLAAETDPGKEREFRGALATLREPLAALWPDLFPAPGPAPLPEPEAPRGP